VTTLSFIPGAGCTSDIFAAQLHAFPHALVVDLPDGGESIESLADAVSTQLLARGEGVILCGFSMGAAVALELAARNDPSVRGVVALGAGARLRVAPALLTQLDTDFEGATRTIAGYLYADAPEEVVARTAGMMRGIGQPRCSRDFLACDRFDIRERLGGIAVPVLAITGERDVMTPPKYAEFLADRIPGATTRIIPGAGHMVMAERPGETNDAIRAFVTQFD
jgi:pimeloyl-ACP methyl ester carboxylesterase